MNKISVAPSGRHFVKDGAPHGLVIDTAWSAFCDASEDEWREYLAHRQRHGFTTIAVSLLPILHDRVEWDGARHPFEMVSPGVYDFDRISPEYMANARLFSEIAADHGLEMAIVVLWCNYVPGSWAAKLTPGSVMSPDQRRSYISVALAAIADVSAILIVSGDDHFSDPVTIEAYSEALEQVRREAPHCLTTMHSSPLCDLPAIIADSPDLDFYSYQSGHFLDRQHLAWDLAQQYFAKPVVRPIVNLEPCYEQLGTAEGTYRFQQGDVRRAMWMSILGGASAGIGYGSHGLWQWYSGTGHVEALGPWLQPFHWRSALRQPAAKDAAFAMDLVLRERLGDLRPNSSLVRDRPTGFYAATNAAGSLSAVYAPFCRPLALNLDVADFELEAWDLERQQKIVVEWAPPSQATIPQVDRAGDYLFIVRARAAR